MRPLKIALVCDWFLPRIGGIEGHLDALGRHLCARGHRVHLITCFPDAGPGQPGHGRVALCPGFEVIRLPLALLPGAMVMVSPRGPARIQALLARENYDVVHSHFSVISPFALAGLFAAKQIGIPAIITFHSFLNSFVRVLRGLDRVTGWTNWPRAFTAVSQPVADQVRALGPRLVSLLPNGIDPDLWAPGKPAVARPGIRLVSVMRLARKKRGSALIKIFSKLNQRVGKKAGLELVIIGSGYMHDRMAKKIKASGLEKKIRLLGYRPREEIRGILWDSDLFVLPCRVESFGIAALEARSLGLPVVAMAGTGVSTFIREDKEGVLARDDADMVRILAHMIQHPDIITRIREHNRRVPCPFTWDRVVGDHEALYASLTPG